MWLRSCPMLLSSSASMRVLLHVQRKGDSGSPRVTGSISLSRLIRIFGSFSIVFFLPPPVLRILSISVCSMPCNSLRPVAIVLGEIPVACETLVIPPHPRITDSTPKNILLVRSFRYGFINSYLWLIVFSSIYYNISHHYI